MSSHTAPESKQGTISLGDEEAVKQVLVDTKFTGLWEIVNNLTPAAPRRAAEPLPGHDLRLAVQAPAGNVRLRRSETPLCRAR